MSTPDTEVRIDAHVHLWEVGSGQYSWLTPEHGILYDDFTAEQAGETLADAGVGQAILVQADDTAADTEMMLSAAATHDWIVGVVGWLPLEDPAATARLLEKWGHHAALCGVRALIHNDPRPHFLALDSVRESLGLVAQAGLAFDVPDAFPRYLDQVVDLAQAMPGLRVVVDHLGKPPRGGNAEELERWQRQLAAVAAMPNTTAKLSGLHSDRSDYSAQALERVWDIALSAFGPARLMFGGDWPVSLLGGSYRETVEIAESLLSSLSPEEARSLWVGTAQRVYDR
ncbi:amidohydrolase family protein [Arthrobacter sp. TWP1-1]|uniref:amidohydrolase family protein n=1 Tax=Arthrobacter sp. TWP1-1 TaxID=2804568 RepID=UPI003CEE9B97